MYIHPVAAIAVLAIALIYFVPYTPIFGVPSKPLITNSTSNSSGLGITFKTIHFWKFDMHPCPDAPDIFCIGPHMINETILQYQRPLNITPPILPPLKYPLKYQNLTPGLVPPPLPP